MDTSETQMEEWWGPVFQYVLSNSTWMRHRNIWVVVRSAAQRLTEDGDVLWFWSLTDYFRWLSQADRIRTCSEPNLRSFLPCPGFSPHLLLSFSGESWFYKEREVHPGEDGRDVQGQGPPQVSVWPGEQTCEGHLCLTEEAWTDHGSKPNSDCILG